MIFCSGHTKIKIDWPPSFNRMPRKDFKMYMSESGATNPAFNQLPSKSPFSPQMT